MGVKGLWQLLQPTGHPVSLESLEGKVLGIDVSLWLHQAVKGMRDQEGGALDNAHLLSLFHRVCKLLFYRIKPVFVFDGGVPLLKRETLRLRQQRKELAETSTEKATRKIVNNQLKQHALNAVLGVATSNTTPASSRQPDLFELPPLPEPEGDESQPEEPSVVDFSAAYDDLQYIDDVDLESSDFLSLPAEIQHELLTELKESRRRTGWAKLNTLPQASVDFSNYQIAKLMKQSRLTQKIEQVRRDMNAKTSGDIALSLAGNVSASQIESRKVMSEDGAHYILVKGLSTVTKTVDDTSGDVISLSDILTQDGHVSSVTAEGVTQRGDRRGDGYDTPLSGNGWDLEGRANGRVKYDTSSENVKECKTILGLGDNDITSDDRWRTESDALTQPQRNDGKCEDVDLTHTVGRSVSSTQDSLTQVHDMSYDSDTESPPDVTVVERTNSKELEVSRKVNNDVTPRCSIECLSQRDGKNYSPVYVTSSIAAVMTSVTGEQECLDGQIEAAEAEETLTDRQMEEVNDESDSDGDFIEVTPVITETTVQYEPLTISDSPHDSDVDSNGHTPSDQHPLHSVDQPNSPAGVDGNIFEGLSRSDLEDLQGALQADSAQLEQERGKKQRSAATITGQMYTEAQELLQLFGVPYMTSPMEAEAQCAYLDMTEQTEGSVTDDSDVWLFGGQRVYKNFFNQNRDVELYKMSDITAYLLLDRTQCISLSLLCGSDYTEGIQGVGPVTAMEILAEFPDEGIERLERFRDWWKETQKTDKMPHETKIKGQLRKLKLHPGFPSHVVSEAYMTPAVDESREAFQWSLPDLDQLREFTKTRFGWTQQKVDESLLPVLKRLTQTQCQRSISTYFPAQITNTKRLKSKRVKAVLNRIKTPDVTSPQNEKASAATVKAKRRRKNVTESHWTPATSGGFLNVKKAEVQTEVVLSESSSGSDDECKIPGSSTRGTLKRLTTAPSVGRGKNTLRRQRKMSG